MPITTADLFSIETTNALIVQPLYVQSVALATLARHETVATTVYLPQVTQDVGEWYAELDTIVESTADANELPVTPKKVGALKTISAEASGDANAAAIIGQALVSELAAATDKAFFAGATPKGPAGLPAISGVGSVDNDPTNLDGYIDAIAAVETAGGAAGAIYVNPTAWAALSKVKATAGGAAPVLNPVPGVAAPRALYGIPVYVSKYVDPLDAWVLDTQRTVAVVRMPFSVVADTSAAFEKDGVIVRCIGRLEFASVYPSTIVRIKNVP